MAAVGSGRSQGRHFVADDGWLAAAGSARRLRYGLRMDIEFWVDPA